MIARKINTSEKEGKFKNKDKIYMLNGDIMNYG